MASFFKIPKHTTFDYKPLYYDEKKEEREHRNELIKQELGIESVEYKSAIKGSFSKRSWTRKYAQRSTNIRILIIVLGLSVLSYYLFYS